MLAQVATKCFRSWQCLQLNDGTSWLEEDYSVSCLDGSAEYERIYWLAWVGIAVWQVCRHLCSMLAQFAQRWPDCRLLFGLLNGRHRLCLCKLLP